MVIICTLLTMLYVVWNALSGGEAPLWPIGIAISFGVAGLADEKGYSRWIWFFAGGLVGLLALFALPKLEDANLTPESKLSKRRLGDAIGGLLAIASAVLMVVLVTNL